MSRFRGCSGCLACWRGEAGGGSTWQSHPLLCCNGAQSAAPSRHAHMLHVSPPTHPRAEGEVSSLYQMYARNVRELQETVNEDEAQYRVRFFLMGTKRSPQPLIASEQ
jgi:hypothetical protein